MNHFRQFQQIKLALPTDLHNRVRLAAAIQQMSMTAFCREVVAAEANRLTRHFPVSPSDNANIPHPATREKASGGDR